MVQNKRKRCYSRSQLYDVPQSTHPISSANEESEMPERKRQKLIDDTEAHSPFSSQVHQSPVDLSYEKDVVYEVRPSDDGPKSSRVYEAGLSEQKKSRQSSRVKKDSQAKIQEQPGQTAPPQTFESSNTEDSKATSDSSGRKRKRSCSESSDNRCSKRRIKDAESASSILGRYKIGKKLGEGGFGAVYKGRRLSDDLKVAIKFADKERNWESITIPGYGPSIPLEVGLLILANQGEKVDQIVELLEWEDMPGQYVMVMGRPSPSEDLSDYITRYGGALNEDIAKVIMWQAAYAAYVCHQRGVFHRDIKPENLLINPQTLDITLIDFGCGDRLKNVAYTEFCGTRAYFPPEFKNQGSYKAEPATVWSLGMMLCKIVCGQLPFDSELGDISAGEWDWPGLSKECNQLISAILQKKPNKRLKLVEIIHHPWFTFLRNVQQ